MQFTVPNVMLNHKKLTEQMSNWSKIFYGPPNLES